MGDNIDFPIFLYQIKLNSKKHSVSDVRHMHICKDWILLGCKHFIIYIIYNKTIFKKYKILKFLQKKIKLYQLQNETAYQF